MFNLSKLELNLNFFLKSLTILLVISLFFPVRHVFLTNQAYLSAEYSDFTSFSLYLSDIIIFATFVLMLITRRMQFYHVVKPLKWLILVLILALVAHFSSNTALSLYLLLRWLELIVAYGTFVVIFKEFDLKPLILKLFAWLCSFEALLALVQFAKQSSVGLFKVGEQHLSPSILGVAKIVSGGSTYIRGYGTFPHPNALSAALISGIFIVLYLLVTSTRFRLKVTYSLLAFLNILGLTVTFSRGAYLALAGGLIVFFGYLIFTKAKSISVAILVALVSIAISFFVFKPLLLTRVTFSDQSTIARKFYDITGVKMAIKNPILGIGLGESMLHMEQYSGRTLAPWDKQPPHNYFIIAAAELGIPAAFILLWIFLWHLKSLILNLKSKFSTYNLLLVTILICFLLLMQFDHYFYTLEQTQLLLWFILAMITVETKNPQKGDPPKT